MAGRSLAVRIGGGYSDAQVQGGEAGSHRTVSFALYVGKLSMTDRRETLGC
jgi:hypothetical protein